MPCFRQRPPGHAKAIEPRVPYLHIDPSRTVSEPPRNDALGERHLAVFGLVNRYMNWHEVVTEMTQVGGAL